MWNKLFPKTADNNYMGHFLGMLILMAFVAKSFLSGSIHMFASDGGAMSIASVALDQFSGGGAESVITMFGLWGMEQFVIGLIALVILLRYRGLVPMMALVYAVEYAGRMASSLFTPGLVTAHTPPGAAADMILVPLTLVMLVLTLYIPKKNRK